MGLKICYFGFYDPTYTRVRVILKGLRNNGVEVIECRTCQSNMVARYFDLLYIFLKNVRSIDLILVSEAGHAYVPLAKLLSFFIRKPVVFDVYLSRYLVSVIEAKKYSAGSLYARFLHLLDSMACRIADKILLDTDDHIEYFCTEYGLKQKKFVSVPIGADEEWFKADQNRNYNNPTGVFKVLYVGTFNPLQGNEHVIGAAEILRDYKDIHFEFYGDGPRREQIEFLAREHGLENVKFHGAIPSASVPSVMIGADLCLGVFGKTTQVEKVVPCKIYEALAMGLPLLTGKSLAVSRYLSHEKDVYFCQLGDAESLADAIIKLKENPEMRRQIGENGLALFRKTATTKVIGSYLKEVFEKLHIEIAEMWELPDRIGDGRVECGY